MLNITLIITECFLIYHYIDAHLPLHWTHNGKIKHTFFGAPPTGHVDGNDFSRSSLLPQADEPCHELREGPRCVDVNVHSSHHRATAAVRPHPLVSAHLPTFLTYLFFSPSLMYYCHEFPCTISIHSLLHSPSPFSLPFYNNFSCLFFFFFYPFLVGVHPSCCILKSKCLISSNRPGFKVLLMFLHLFPCFIVDKLLHSSILGFPTYGCFKLTSIDCKQLLRRTPKVMCFLLIRWRKKINKVSVTAVVPAVSCLPKFLEMLPNLWLLFTSSEL